ncbi:asparagine synthase-related protein [Thermoactinomyces sp. DSM 45892]|uniref:asparagine synthase-related protein n=1 Tax=Thermoactinomyces sp. DSM 45892 TaxID=1882753 RepID=UPI00089C26F1|nr:asparagine synthase-related protein [Thermoactinomyces sp. DSM 45892]SDY25466.1 Asparagine synthetase B (glutamine-hydrolyzing) [Thermoactinomyces sp. DSM 45892]
MLAIVTKHGEARILIPAQEIEVDIRGSTIVVTPDLANFYPLFVAGTEDALYISTRQIWLKKILGAELDQQAVATYLQSGGKSFSLFKGIEYIKPAHGVILSSDKVKIFPLSISQPYLNLEEGTSLFRQSLLEVIEKLPHQLSSDCSGGLDSTPLTILATKQKQVTAFTLSYPNETEDVRIARLICQQKEIPQVIVEDHPLHYSNVELPLTDEPIDFWFSSAETMHYLSQVSLHHVSGEGGDAVLCSPLSYLRKAPFFIAWSHFFRWSRNKKRSPLSLFRSIRRPSYFRGDWITEKVPYRVEQSSWIDLWDTAKTCRLTSQLAESIGKTIYFPFLDDDVVRVCFSIYEYERMNPNCLKPLIKQAFPELPTVLLERNTKGNYTTDLYRGYQQNYQLLREQMDTMILADMGVIQIQQFHEAMEKMNMGLYVPLWEFDFTMAVEMWLRTLRREKDVPIPCDQESGRGDNHFIRHEVERILCSK